ncbi:hypothetical protein CIP101434_00651 [Corynebacterium diphtheriae]|nr:hypothetical protein CIP101280_00361 [Corynebacterium diphtheriae]CAB0497645.1 hypothetical protein CIP101434_00651 [Corynebacterium diphtheriae]
MNKIDKTALDLPAPKQLEDDVYRWPATHMRLRNDYSLGVAMEIGDKGGVTVAYGEIFMDVDHGEQILSSSDAWNLGLALLAAGLLADRDQEETV